MNASQRQFIAPTFFTLACVAVSVLAVTTIWSNYKVNPTVTVSPPADSPPPRPKNRRRKAVDSLYGGATNAPPLTTISRLLCRCADASRALQDVGDRSPIQVTLSSELVLLTTSLCRLQQALSLNESVVTANPSISACYLASMSGLGSTMSLLENGVLSEDATPTSTAHELIQQLRNHRPGLDFLMDSVGKERPLPTPPAENVNDLSRLSVETQLQTGMTPQADMKCWVEPPPEYSATDAPANIDEKQDIKEPLPDGADDNASSPSNDTSPLHEAITNNDPQTLQHLLTTTSISPNTPTGPHQSTPLHLAAHLNHTACIPLLLHHGALLTAEDAKGDTPLHLAAWSGHVEALSTLLAHGAEIDWLSGRDGYSALWCAISACEIDAARLLLRHGARVSLRSASGGGLMPLHQAAVMGQGGMCELLLEKGARVDGCDESENTPLHYAAACGAVGCLRALLRAGAAVGARTTHGLTPLHWAAHKGHVEAMRILLGRAACVDVSAVEGATPLHLAANRGHLAAVKLLLGEGADRDIEAEAWDGGSGRAVDMARLKGHGRVVAVLEE